LVHPFGAGPYYDTKLVDAEGRAEVYPGYVTDVITDYAVRFLERVRSTPQPFYLSVHYTAPHSPWGRKHHPHEVYNKYYESCPFRCVPDVPVHTLQANTAPVPFNGEERRQVLSGYYAAVDCMDRNIGRLLRFLEDQGMLENTLVVFTSDNGMNMGHHGLYGKGNATFPPNMFETSVRVPAIFSHGGVLNVNTRSSELTSHYDIMPTVLDYAGIEHPVNAVGPGTSLVPLLNAHTDQQTVQRDYLVVFSEYGPVHMIRDSRWKYVHRYPYGPHELYDLQSDPDEVHNVYPLGEYDERAQLMQHQIGRWFADHSVPHLDGRVLPVTGRGQTALVSTSNAPVGCFMRDWYFVRTDPQSHRDYEL